MTEQSRREWIKDLVKGTVYTAPAIRSLAVPRTLAAQGPGAPGACADGPLQTFADCRQGGGSFCLCCQSTQSECGSLTGILGFLCSFLCGGGGNLQASDRELPPPRSQGIEAPRELPGPPWRQPPGGRRPPGW